MLVCRLAVKISERENGCQTRVTYGPNNAAYQPAENDLPFNEGMNFYIYKCK